MRKKFIALVSVSHFNNYCILCYLQFIVINYKFCLKLDTKDVPISYSEHFHIIVSYTRLIHTRFSKDVGKINLMYSLVNIYVKYMSPNELVFMQ